MDAIKTMWQKLDLSTRLLVIGVGIYLFMYIFIDVVLAIARAVM